MVYHMTIAGLERDLPVCKVSDSLYIGAFVIFGDQELTVAAARELLKKAPPYDYLITAEAKGIPLVHEMARQNGDKKYMLARKGPKLYMTGVFDVAVHSITTAKEQHLYLDTADAALMAGKHPHCGRCHLHRGVFVRPGSPGGKGRWQHRRPHGHPGRG